MRDPTLSAALVIESIGIIINLALLVAGIIEIGRIEIGNLRDDFGR